METQEQKYSNLSSNTIENKTRTTKWLAVFGLFALVLALAWFIFTVIAFVPNALSLAGSVLFTNEPEEVVPSEIILENREITTLSGEIATLSWIPSTEPQPGSYAIWFACVDGVSVQVVTPDDGIQNINCETYYDIGERTTLNVELQSSAMEVASVEYEIAFVSSDESFERHGSVGTLTIENPALALAEEETEAEVVPEEDVIEQSVIPEYREDIVYQQPQSDPQGVTDLGVRFAGVGVIEDGAFAIRRSFEENKRGAIRFEVTNHGTQTSEDWTYTATLPNGQIYESPKQQPLRPKESATISLGFRSPAEAGTYPFSVMIETTRDISSANHSFSWSVLVD